MNWPSRMAAVAAMTAAIGSAGAVASDDLPDQAPIRIASFDWTSSALTSTILAKILAAKGYSVQLVASSSLASAIGDLSSGTLTIGLEYRMTGVDSDPAKLVEDADVADLGPLGPVASQVWWYPDYVKESCPGLPALGSLAACAQIFSSPQSNGRGLMLSEPVGWGYDDDARVAALGLPFDVVHVATDTSIAERVAAAAEKKEPILISLGLPHWIPAKYKGETVDVPKWTRECDQDPAWGRDPTRVKDCGGPASDIRKFAWPAMREKWPGAWAIAKGIRFDEGELDEMLLEIDYQGKALDDIAQKWIENHKAQIDMWSQTK